MGKKLKVAVLVSGGGTNLQALIDKERAGETGETEIVRVISDREDAFALKRAESAGIKTSVAVGRDGLMKALREANADLVVLAGYVKILDPAVVDRFKGRMINIHPSLIPKHCGRGYYGMRVHESVLAAGDKISGATVHYVDEGVDTGKIILQASVPVMKDDTPDSLGARVLEKEHEILAEGLKKAAADFYQEEK